MPTSRIYIDPAVKRMIKRAQKNKLKYVRKPKRLQPKTKLQKLIRKEINKAQELKSTTMIGTSGSSIKTGGVDDLFSTGYVSRDLCAVSIDQGTGVSDRIGNKILIKSNKLKITVNSLYLEQNSAPFRLHIVFYRNRNFNSSATGLAELMQFENTALSQNGTLLREQYPFNKDVFEIKKHIVKRMVYVPATGTNDINNATRFSYTMSVDISKYCPAVWRFDDNDAGTPENSHLFFCCYIVPENDNVPAGLNLCNIVWSQTVNFTDS